MSSECIDWYNCAFGPVKVWGNSFNLLMKLIFLKNNVQSDLIVIGNSQRALKWEVFLCNVEK